MRGRRAGIAAVAAAVALAGGAGADSVGALSFRAPAEWKPCPGAEGGLCSPSGSARIVVKAPAPGDPAKLARAQAKGTTLKDQAVTFAGQPAHVILAGDDQQVVIAIATAAAGGAMVTLTAPTPEAQEAFHAWFALVQSATLGEAPPAPADATPRRFRLKNAANDCEALVYVDGKRYALAPGAESELTLEPGKHVVEWWQRDGSGQAAAIDVPPAEELSGSCAPPESLGPRPGEEAAAPDDARKPIFAGARAAVLFYRGLWNLVLGGERWPAPKSLDRLMLKLLAATPAEAQAGLAAYVGRLAALERAIEKTAGDEAARARLRRVAAEMLLAAGQLSVHKNCPAPPEDPAAGAEARAPMLDCVLARYGRLGVDGPDTMNERFLRLAGVAAPPAALMSELEALGR